MEAYDSVSGQYFSENFRRENKCYKNNDRRLKDMAGFLLKKSEQHQAQQELGKAGKLISAALAAVFKWIVKIGTAIYSGNPGFVLAPISLDDEDDTIIEPSIEDLYFEPLEEDESNTNLENDEENESTNILKDNGENDESNSSIGLN